MSSWKPKVILVGSAAVGKTSLLWRFIKNRFQANYKLTTGVDILTKDVEFRPGEIATLSIWDIGGQQRFDFIRDTFYKGAGGVLLIFDLTREATYTEAKKRLSDIRQYAGNIPFALIGNKEDLLKDIGRVIDPDDAKHFTESEDGIYIETSAKTGVNVENAFMELTRLIIKNRESYGEKKKKKKKKEPCGKKKKKKKKKKKTLGKKKKKKKRKRTLWGKKNKKNK